MYDTITPSIPDAQSSCNLCFPIFFLHQPSAHELRQKSDAFSAEVYITCKKWSRQHRGWNSSSNFGFWSI
jgi:hypothetical protein